MAYNLPGRSDDFLSVQHMLVAKDVTSIGTVLQLPVAPWPEAPPIKAFQPYDHQLPFIFDRVGSSTRWSYGAALPQASFKTVQKLVEQHQAGGLVTAAAALGFDAILVEKEAFNAEELDRFRSILASDDVTVCIVFDDSFRTLYGMRDRTHQTCSNT